MAETGDKTQTEKIFHTARRLLYWAAGLSIGILLAHVVDLPDHLTEWWGYASFYMATGTTQFLFGFLLLFRPWRYDDTGGERKNSEYFGRPYYMLGTVIAAVVILFYIVTRTYGMPFAGPGAGPEKLTPLSLVFLIDNLLLLYCLIRLYVVTGSMKKEMKLQNEIKN